MNIVIEKLDWDSQFFGFEVGRLNWEDGKTIPWTKIQSIMRNYSLCYVFSNQEVSTSGNSIYHSKRIAYKKTGLASIKLDTQLISQLFESNSEVEKLAVEAGRYSRFKKDHRMPSDAVEKMYHVWLNNCFVDSAENQCWVYKIDDVSVGLICSSFKNDTCHITLLAVHPEYRNQGIASSLLQKVEQVAFDLEISSMTISSQGANEEANQLYLKKGFQKVVEQNIYHLWNPILK